NPEDLLVATAQFSDAFQAASIRAAAVKSAHHDRYSRPGFLGDERNFLERFSNNAERHFRLSIPARQTKIPVHDVLATPVPFVGPSINECPRASCGEGLSYLQVQGSSLRLVSIPVAVKPDFRSQQRTFAGAILNPWALGLLF